ncbi:MAG: mechanosensitive ion channel family protein, partial [archaeon]
IMDYPILGNTLKQYLVLVLFVFLGFFVSKIIILLSKGIFKKISEKTKTKMDDVIIGVLQKPFPIIIFIETIFLNIGFSFLNLTPGFITIEKKILFVVYVFCVASFLIRFILGIIKEYIETSAAKTESKFDDQLIPLLKTLTQILIIIFSVLVTLSYFGYNVGALLAGLGIGGLAIAFAAKDLLENLISGVVIFAEKPFHVGDKIKNTDIDGTVKEVGIRSTRVETYDGTLIIVPNSKIAINPLENVTFRRARREKVTLGLVYATSTEKLEKAKKIIAEILEKDKDVDNYRDKPDIYFDGFGDYALNLKIIYWVKKEDFSEFVKVKDRVNFEIKKRFEKEKIEFAFPTQTIELKK